MESRLCSSCGAEKPLTTEYWHKDSRKKHGFMYICKECRSRKRRKTEQLPIAKNGFKICTRCREDFPSNADYFFKDASAEGGLYPACKFCMRKTPISRKDGYKICIRCLREFPKARKHFSKNQSSTDGFLGYCKECQGRSFVLKQKFLIESDKEGHKICSKCGTELLLNKENFNVAKNSQDGFTSVCKKCRYEYTSKNREMINERYREYRKNNKELFHNIKVRRTMRKKGLVANFSVEDWRECLDYFDYSCAYCGKKTDSLQQDHFIPVAHDGDYTKSNIVPACQRCNPSKRDRDFFKWYPLQEYYDVNRLNKILKYLDDCTDKSLSLEVGLCHEKENL